MSGPRRPGVPLGRLVSGAWLLLVWLAVTGSYTTGSLVGGVVVVVVLMTFFPHGTPGREVHRVRPVMLARYLVHFLRNLVVANLHVARAVLVPRRVRHRRGIVAVPLPHSSRLVQAVLANAVSLTPGTSIIEVTEEPPSLHVHVLELDRVAEVRRAVAELHWRLVRAIGPEEHLPGVTAAVEELRREVERGADAR